MNQDEFRRLLSNPTPGASSSRFNPPSTKKSSIDPSQPAFQPRKVKKKKAESTYRDRASDRRAGINDYAEVESILEDFEKRTAGMKDRDIVEEQRRYLGGDKDHTILVKGLDFALLEQNKSRAVDCQKEDDSLEAAFQEAQSKSTVPIKRSREDIIKALKEKRATSGGESSDRKGEVEALEKAKQIGKFRPIGAPEPSNTVERKQGKGKSNMDDHPKKKKRKIAPSTDSLLGKGCQGQGETSQVTVASASSHVPLLAREEKRPSVLPEAPKNVTDFAAEPDDDHDIFPDAGEYQGIDFEEEHEAHPIVPSESRQDETTAPLISADNTQSKRWFADEDTTPIGFSKKRTPTPPPEPPESSEHEPITRLAPLASSALPSIRDFLAMETQVEAQEKRKAKKEKKRGDKKEKDNREAKVNRDYQKLNSYMTQKK